MDIIHFAVIKTGIRIRQNMTSQVSYELDCKPPRMSLWRFSVERRCNLPAACHKRGCRQLLSHYIQFCSIAFARQNNSTNLTSYYRARRCWGLMMIVGGMDQGACQVTTHADVATLVNSKQHEIKKHTSMLLFLIFTCQWILCCAQKLNCCLY